MPASVLIIQTGFLGDAVLATGMLRSLYEIAPSVKAGFLVREEFADLFRGHPGITVLHAYNKRAKGGMASIVEEIKREEYSAALIPHRSIRSALLPFRAAVKSRIGFRQSDSSLFFTKRVEYDIALREIDRNALLLQSLGIATTPAQRRGWLLPLPEVLHDMRERYRGERIIALAPGSVWETKRWPAEKFALLAAQLQGMGYRVLLIGSQKERALCESIMQGGKLFADDMLAGKLSLPQLVALCSVVHRVITNDSAPLHIAESLGTPVTALFGPTVPEFGFAPYLPESNVVERRGLPCRPCGIHGHRTCPVGTHECMVSLHVDDVLATVESPVNL